MTHFGHEERELANGLRLVWMALPNAQSLHVNVLIRAGLAYETRANNGISHFVEHLLFGRTRGRDRRETSLDPAEFGISVQGATGLFTVEMRLAGPPAHLREMGVLLREVLEPRPFRPEFVATERAIIDTERNSRRGGSPPFEPLFPGHVLGLPIIGTARSIAGLDAHEISRFAAKYFSPERIVVTLAGRIESGLFEQFAGALASLPRNNEAPAEPAPLRPVRMPLVRTHWWLRPLAPITVGYLVPRAHSERMSIADGFLQHGIAMGDDGLQHTLRYRANVYKVGLWQRVLGPMWIWGVYGVVPMRQNVRFVTTIVERIAAQRDVGEVQRWLERERRNALRQIELLSESPAELAALVGHRVLRGGDRPTHLGASAEAMRDIQAEEIAEYASKWLRRDHFFVYCGSVVPMLTRRRLRAVIDRALG